MHFARTSTASSHHQAAHSCIKAAGGPVNPQNASAGAQPASSQDVTLGGTGKETGDRHPKISDNVLIGAAAKALGNIHIGKGALIAPGRLVLRPVEANTMVAGAPAQFVGCRKALGARQQQQQEQQEQQQEVQQQQAYSNLPAEPVDRGLPQGLISPTGVLLQAQRSRLDQPPPDACFAI